MGILTMFPTLVAAFIIVVLSQSLAATSTGHGGSLGPRPGQIKNLVTFGDSYTDVVS